MWRALPPDAAAIVRLRAARERFDLRPLAIHTNYLINLASLDTIIRRKSIDGFRGELERAAAIGAEYLVVHPGSYRGSSAGEGIAAVAAGLAEASLGIEDSGVTVLIENTVGAGCHLGGSFEELRAIRDRTRDQSMLPVGYCLDTCHLLAAGFNIATAPGLRATIDRAEKTLGLAHVRLIHANDSKGALGSHLDRHAQIGAGQIGLRGFRRILTHPQLRRKPFILETPVEGPGDDRRNLDTLKSLALG